jgi:hypothetical protein
MPDFVTTPREEEEEGVITQTDKEISFKTDAVKEKVEDDNYIREMRERGLFNESPVGGEIQD